MQPVKTKDENRLTLRRRPINVWIAAIIIIGLGIAGLVAVIIQHNDKAWVGVIVFLVPLIFGGVMIGTCGRIEEAIFSRSSGHFYILKRALFGYKKLIERGDVSDIVGVEIENKQPDSGNWLFRETLILSNGRKVPVSGYHTKLRKARATAKSIRDFLHIEEDQNVDPDLLELEFIGE